MSSSETNELLGQVTSGRERKSGEVHRVIPVRPGGPMTFAEFVENERLKTALKRAVETGFAPEYLIENIRRAIRS